MCWRLHKVCMNFIHYVDLYSASSRSLLKSAPDSSTAKNSSFKARVECVRVNPGVQSQCQFDGTHSKQRGQPPRMHASGELKHGQKRQRLPPVPLSGDI